MAITTCDVSGKVVCGDNTTECGAYVYARPYNPPASVTGENTQIASSEVVATIVSGAWTLTLIRGKVYRISIPATGEDKLYTIPDASTANFENLVEYNG